MIKILDKMGAVHRIAHLTEDDLPLLRAMQQRFNGELALWRVSNHLWLQLADLDLATAANENAEMIPRPP
jgi:hypothetical protein